MLENQRHTIVKTLAFDPHAIDLLDRMAVHRRGIGAFLSGLITAEYERRQQRQRDPHSSTYPMETTLNNQ